MDDDHSQQVESQLQLYWQGLYDNGIAAHELDNVFDFFELHNREGEAFTNNMGMNVIGKYNNLIRYGITIPEDSNSLDILQNIRQKLNDHSYLQSLLKTYFLDNKSTFTFLSKASPAYGSNLTEQINTQLRQKEALLTLEQKEDIISQNRELELFRLKDRNIEELPKLVLNDIQPLYPQDKKYTTTLLNNGVEIKKFTEDTNRVSYLKMYFPLVFRNQEELFYKKLAIQIMNRINLKGKTVKETSLWKQTKLGDLRTQLTIFTHNQDDFDTYVLMEAKGLSEYTDTIIEKTLSFTKDLEWSDVSLITNSINSIWRDYMNDYQSEAHVFAINESQAALSNHLALKKSLNREYFTQFIYSIVNGINDTINSEQFRTNVITKLQGAYKDLFIYSPKVFFCGDSPDIVESQLAQVPFQCNVPAFAGIYKHRQQSKQNALDANTEINYVAYSLAMPTDDHTDSGKLLVLAAYIHSYLITNVREKAGAYGVQASYNTNGIFTMFSYRDKKPLNTIEVFNAVGEYLLTHTINNELFNSSKLSLLQNFNKPTEAIHDAVRVFSNTLKKTVLDEKLLIDTALGMQPEELRDLAKKYFIDNKPSISVATNGDTIETSFADWTQINLAPVSDEL